MKYSMEKTIENTEHWKEEIKKMVQHVIQSEISDIILPLKNSSSSVNMAISEPMVPDTDKEILVGEKTENVKAKYQNHFSNVSGFSYSGKPIEKKKLFLVNRFKKWG